ncbi:MAG: hypothetical protein AAF039_09695 [Bacteroidota bacterium]
MSTKKQSTNNENKETAVVSKTATVATKSTTQKKDVFGDLMEHLNELEQLRKYYNKLKEKRDNLVVAQKQMSDSLPNDPFEESSNEEFPFEIILRGKTKYNNVEDIFKINQKKTVENFTSHLLNQVNQLLEVFEADILEHSKKIK